LLQIMQQLPPTGKPIEAGAKKGEKDKREVT
jgi:hypothetical protein